MRAHVSAVGFALILILSGLLSAQQGARGIGGAGSATPGRQASPLPPRDGATAATGTASITGRVVAADNGRPLRLAQVQLNSPAIGRTRTGRTDANGQYSFTGLPAGRYTLTASRPGYVMQPFGPADVLDGAYPLDLAEGQRAERIDFALPRGGAITGRVVDEAGDGATGVRVQALRLQYSNVGTRTVPAGVSAPTDDLGQFRIYGLTPGDYLVRAEAGMGVGTGAVVNIAVAQGGMAPGGLGRMLPGFPGDLDDANENYAPTYYPGAANAASAQVVAVQSGRDAVVHFAMPVVRYARVSGMVVDSQGRPFTEGFVQLRQGGAGATLFARSATPLRAGAFTFANLAPGDYLLTFQSNYFKERNNVIEVASFPVTVDGTDVAGLVVATVPGGIVSGRLVFEGRSPPDLTKVFVNAAPVEGGPIRPGPNLPPAADGRFELRGLVGPVLFRPAIPAREWALKSVTVNGQDITDVPCDFRGGEHLTGLTITLTDRLTSVAGTVRDDRGAAVKEFAVVMLPQDLPAGALPGRFVRVVRPDREGRFTAANVPPGAYVVAAFPAIGQTQEWDPRFQDVVRKVGSRLSLSHGEAATIDLAVATP
jgi:hypothetical protein